MAMTTQPAAEGACKGQGPRPSAMTCGAGVAAQEQEWACKDKYRADNPWSLRARRGCLVIFNSRVACCGTARKPIHPASVAEASEGRLRRWLRPSPACASTGGRHGGGQAARRPGGQPDPNTAAASPGCPGWACRRCRGRLPAPRRAGRQQLKMVRRRSRIALRTRTPARPEPSTAAGGRRLRNAPARREREHCP